tara:strand:- start:2480 stop:4717 length:2238 start_codon:yes stop_codon:yes gene_type:complete
LADKEKQYKNQEEILKAINAEYDKELKYNRQILSIQQKLTDALIAQERLSEKTLQQMQSKATVALNRIAAAERATSQEQVTLNNVEKELAIRQKVNASLGIGGSIIKTLAGSLGAFGKTLGLGDAAKAMEDAAYEADSLNKSFSKTQALAVGLKSIGGSIANSLTDPSVIIGSILASFGELQKAEKEFRQQTGQSLESQGVLNSSMATGVDFMKAATSLSKELGVNASNIFKAEDIAEVAELTENMGLSAHSAAVLAKLAKKSGQELSVVKDNIASAANDFVKSNMISLNLKDVMEDVGGASYAIQASMGGSVENIQAAAMEARKLGISLEQVDKIAGSLLNFEESIAAEMNAELLLGRSINLERARGFALNNKLAELAQEIGKQEAIMMAFSTGNRIQQEAAAAAIGLSREELAKMVLQQNIQKFGNIAQAAAASDMSVTEAERLTTSEQLSKSVAKITQGLAAALVPIAGFLENTAALYTTMGLIGGIITLKIAGGLIKSTKEVISFGAAAAKSLGLMTASKGGGAIADTALDQVKKVSEATKSSGPAMGAAGRGIGMFLKGIAVGFRALASPMVLLGLAAVTGAIIGIGFAMKLAAPAFATFGGIISSIFAGVATVITAVAQGFVNLMGALNMENIGPLLLLGPALLGISVGLAAMAVSGIMALPAIAGLVALSLVAEPLIRLAELGVIGTGGGGEGKDNEKDSMVVKKLDQLIAVVQSGGDVILDGNKVGRNLSLASSGIG